MNNDWLNALAMRSLVTRIVMLLKDPHLPTIRVLPTLCMCPYLVGLVQFS